MDDAVKSVGVLPDNELVRVWRKSIDPRDPDKEAVSGAFAVFCVRGPMWVPFVCVVQVTQPPGPGDHPYHHPVQDGVCDIVPLVFPELGLFPVGSCMFQEPHSKFSELCEAAGVSADWALVCVRAEIVPGIIAPRDYDVLTLRSDVTSPKYGASSLLRMSLQAKKLSSGNPSEYMTSEELRISNIMKVLLPEPPVMAGYNTPPVVRGFRASWHVHELLLRCGVASPLFRTLMAKASTETIHGCPGMTPESRTLEGSMRLSGPSGGTTAFTALIKPEWRK